MRHLFSEKKALYFKITDQLQRTLALMRLIQKQLNVLIDCGYGRGGCSTQTAKDEDLDHSTFN